MHQVFYQKYRPINFKQTLGQESIRKILVNAINRDKLPNGYIFSGERGTGKTTFAKIIAKAINCLNWDQIDVCNSCDVCKSINTNSAIDIVEIDAASKNGINDIRELVENVFNHPFTFKKKVYILDEAHMLTTQSWGGLLKTLEESPPYVLFIFTTTEFNKIPLTILSRCQSFFFKKITSDLILERLNDIAKKEKIKMEKDALIKIADLSQGSLRDGLSLLDQISNFSDSEKISITDVEKTFNIVDRNAKFTFIKAVLSGDIKEAFNLLDDFESNGLNFTYFLRELFALTVNLYAYAKLKNINVLDSTEKTMIETLNFEKQHYAFLIKAIEENTNFGLSQLTLIDRLKAIVISYNEFFNQKPLTISSPSNEKSLHLETEYLEKKKIKKSNHKQDQKHFSLFEKSFIDKSEKTPKNDEVTNNKFLDTSKLNLANIALAINAFNDNKWINHFQNLLSVFQTKFNDKDKQNNLSYFNNFIDKYSARDIVKATKIVKASSFGIVILFEDQKIAMRLWKEAIEEGNVQATIFQIFNQNLFLASFSEHQYKTTITEETKNQKYQTEVLNLTQLENLAKPFLKEKKRSLSQKMVDKYFKGLFEEK